MPGLGAFSGLVLAQERVQRSNADLGAQGIVVMMKPMVCMAALAAMIGAVGASAREQIRVVGSSTVFPFSTTVAEQFGAKTGHPAPIVESTGTGGGISLFCEGVGADTPDVANASRGIKNSELRKCLENGVDEIVEVPIGYDGIVVSNAKDAPDYAFTTRHLFLALAEQIPTADDDCAMIDNPNRFWSDVDPELPNVAIEVFGPPPTSGTRDAFVEIAMESGARTFSCLDTLRDEDGDAFNFIAHRLREDGAWIDAGENDNAIINTLERTPTAVGVAGFSFLDQNTDRIKGASINGVEPNFENIAAGDYDVSRSMYLYVKREHVASIEGLHDYVREFVSQEASGQFGYLTDRGLIPLAEDELQRVVDTVETLNIIDIEARIADE